MRIELVIFLTSFSIFSLTLNPSIFPGDSTEFVTAIAVSGVAHPPGYPLLLILGKIFSLIPFISFPVKLNLLSATASALTAVFCCRSIRLLTNSTIGALIGAGLLISSSSFWLYAEVLEAFSLNALFISIFIWQSIVFIKNPSKNKALFLVFILALNASNHHTAALLLPALIALLWVNRKKINPGYKFLATVVAISFLGLFPYVYIVFLAQNNPLLNWDNAINFKNLLNLILRKDFGTFLLAPSALSFTPKTTPLGLYFKDLFKQTFTLLPLFSAAGIIYFFKQKQKIIFSLLAYAFISFGPAFAAISRLQITSIHQAATLERFYIASFVPLAILAGVGAVYITSLLPKRAKIISLILPLLLLPPALYALPQTNQRNNNFYEQYSRKILEELPENAVFITTGDTSDNGTQYLQLVKGIKPGLIIITLPKTVAPWYQEQMTMRYPELGNLLKESPQKIILNLCKHYAPEERLYIASEVSGLKLDNEYCLPMPKGLSIALHPPGSKIDLAKYKEEELEYFKKIQNTLLNHDRPKDLRTERIVYEISAAMDRIGNFLLLRGDKEGAVEFYNMALNTSPHWNISLDSLAVLDAEKGNFAAAIEKEREAIRRNSENPKAYFNLGILLKETGDQSGARSALLEFLSFKPDPRLQEFEMANRALQELENRK